MNPAEIAAVQAVMAALKDAEAGTELQLPDGSRARVEATPPGVRAVQVEQTDGKGWRLRVFEPGIDRPALYPANLPFIPGCKAAITDGSDGHIMATWETPEVDSVADQVTAQSTQEGWVPEPDDPAFARLPMPMQMRQFRRAERTRVIMRMNVGGAKMVSLFDT
ncbi:MAG: hypothetical protein ACRENP_01360 [Longimicrobiales bacterium]